MPALVKHKHTDIGLCPRCSAPGADYEYTIEGPLGESRDTVRITVRIKCPVCGYNEEKRILFPVRALNLVKLLFIPSIRPVVEKLYLLYEVRLTEQSSGVHVESDGVEA